MSKLSMMHDPPCRGCNKRNASCHASCQDYINWSIERNKIKSEIRKTYEKEAQIIGYFSEGKWPNSKRKRCK